LNLPIYCVDCNEPMDSVEIGEIEYGQFMTCPKCKSRFNLWGLYLNFYENIPLARKIADSIVSAVWGNGYTVKGDKPDLTKVDDFLNQNSFGTLLKGIVFDSTVFGQSFIEKTGSTPMLARIDPTSSEAQVGPEQMLGGRAYTMEVQKVVEYQSNGSIIKKVVPKSNLIVFMTEGLSRPTGQSAFGMWVYLWFSLKLAPQALLNTSFMGLKEANELDRLREFAEGQVIMGSGVPQFLAKPETAERFPPSARRFLEGGFRYSTKQRREQLSRQIEEGIFPLALGREYDFNDWLSFEWL